MQYVSELVLVIGKWRVWPLFLCSRILHSGGDKGGGDVGDELISLTILL